jgi:tRNA(Phe) wybutosine-synthesizing methylase Tyw3
MELNEADYLKRTNDMFEAVWNALNKEEKEQVDKDILDRIDRINKLKNTGDRKGKETE